MPRHASIAAVLDTAELAAFFPGDTGEELRALIGPDGLFNPETSGETFPAFLARRRPEALVTHWATPILPATAPEPLRYIAHTTGSVRKIIPRAYLEAGVRVTNWGDVAAEPVAEATLMLILAALRETQHWGRELHDRARWRAGRGQGRTLFDRRVAIHGFGRIARALLVLLKPFRVTVQVFSEGVPADFIRQHGAEPVASLEALFASGAEVLVELEALTPRTAGSVREENLRALPDDSVFVNCGRGPVVDGPALERVAAEGRLRLALDVYPIEPLPASSALRGPANITLMPHVAGPTPDRYADCGRGVIDNLHRWLRGEALVSELSLQAYDQST